MVSFRDALWPEVAAGRVAWNDIEADSVHPNDRGHAICAELVSHLFDLAAESLAQDPSPKMPPPLPNPLISDTFENTSVLTADGLAGDALQGWQSIDGAYGRAWRAETPGQVLEFHLEGTAIGLAYKKQKAGFGRARVSLDGEAIEILEGYFPQDWGGGYTPFFLAKRDLPPGRHRLSITVLDEKADESPGHAFEIHAIYSAGLPHSPTAANLDTLVGQPVDIGPWTYAWRADMPVQQRPEAYFIPRRLARIDKIYRTAATVLPPDQLKSIYYDMPDLLTPLPQAPHGRLLAGLLWTGGLANYQVELHWPESITDIPAPENVEVRVYPTSYGWFGWTVDRVLGSPVVSTDRRVWTYASEPLAKMDWAYSVRVDAATEMVAVFADLPERDAQGGPLIPTLRVISPDVGNWQRIDLEIEWGFLPDREKNDFDGRLDSHVAVLGAVKPLPDDQGTSLTGPVAWRSRPGGGERRGVAVSALYASNGRPGLDSRLTVWTDTTGFTVRLRDLADGPILIPHQGVFICRAGEGRTARQFVQELTGKNLKSVCQSVREHREAASWDEVMREVRLSTCPAGTTAPPFPRVDEPSMQVELSDVRWTDAWRAATQQLRGKHMWGGLAFEVARVAHDMDLIGLHVESNKVYDHFLAAPGAKSDGDYSDGQGAFEWATTMRHDMGYSHDGTHASTGRLLYAMAERYLLTGDRAWLEQRVARMQAAADWIIRQRRTYLQDVPNRQDLFVAGLMPACMLGDYAIPSCDWHWYYVDNALSAQGLQRFADAVSDLDPALGQKYQAEAAAFRSDVRRAVEKEYALAPVRKGRDGLFHSYLPRMAYAAGLPGPELGAPQYPDCDRFMGSLPLAEPYAVIAADDPRMIDTLLLMEEMGTTPESVRDREESRRQQGLAAEDALFWHCFVSLPKASHNANAFLLQDDVPNFLRFWMNSYAANVGADGRLWEHWHLGGFGVCESPDNGTAGWFLENFRNMLVMELGDSLWLARGTPRAWLEQGKSIRVSNAPTCFGPVAYTIRSDVDKGRISATIDMPKRKTLQEVVLRLRHPQAAPIQRVEVNGQSSGEFDPLSETVRLKDVSGQVRILVGY